MEWQYAVDGRVEIKLQLYTKSLYMCVWVGEWVCLNFIYFVCEQMALQNS